MKQKEYEKAQTAELIAKEKLQDHFELDSNLGVIFNLLSKNDEAQKSFDEALKVIPQQFKTEAEKNIADFGDGVKVLKGRYGPYITDGKKNAKIPKDTEPASITHEQAIQMLADAPAAKTKGRFAKRTTATKAKKPAAKKPAAKKKASKPKVVKATRTAKKAA